MRDVTEEVTLRRNLQDGWDFVEDLLGNWCFIVFDMEINPSLT